MCALQPVPEAPILYTRSREETLVTDPNLPVAIVNRDILCDVGDSVVSGGYEVTAGDNRFAVRDHPVRTGGRDGWRLGLQSLAGAIETTATIYVRCLDLTP